MRQSGLYLLAAFALVASVPSYGEVPVLKIATGEYPPYATASRTDRGIALSIVQRAFELAGYQVEYTFLPWSRALAETRLGKWDATAAWGNNPARNPPFWVSDNVVSEQWVFVYRNALKFSWSTLADLKPYRVAMIQEYTYTPEIWAKANAGEFKTDKFPNEAAAIKMLLLDRVDVAPMERNVACDVLLSGFSEVDAAKLSVHPKLMTDSFTSHVLLPRTLPSSAARLADFNRGLKKLKATPEYTKLVSQVKCPSGWSAASAVK